MNVMLKINSQKVKCALLRENYSSISDFAKKAGMSPTAIRKALNEEKCTYSMAYKLTSYLSISADDLIITD